MKKSIWLLPIITLTIIVYLPVVRNGFLVSDDPDQITLNSDIQSLDPSAIAKVFTSFYVGMYQPVTTLSYSLEYHFFGLQPAAFHIDSLILHLINILLAVWLTWILFESRSTALAAGAFFALYPTQVEAVAWASARSSLLVALFSLLALISWLYHLKDKSPKNLILAYLFFLLALLAKVSAAGLPLIIMAVNHFRGLKPKENIRRSWPLFLLSLAFGLLAIWGRKSYGLFTDEPYSSIQSLALLSIAAVRQVGLFFWPFDLSAFYPHPGLDLIYRLVAIIPLGGILALAYWRKNRLVLFCSLWFLFSILLSIQILPHTLQIAADRYNYLALLGPVWLSAELLRRPAYLRYHKIIIGVAIILLAVLAVESWGQAQTWQNDLTVWDNAAKISPGSPLIWYNLGEIYRSAGKTADALAIADQQLALHPNYANLYYLRGLIELNDSKEYRQAIADFQSAIAHKPDLPAYYYSQALAEIRLGRLNDAGQSLEKAATHITKPKQELFHSLIREQRQIIAGSVKK